MDHADQGGTAKGGLLDPDTPDAVRLSVPEAIGLGMRALRGIGYTEEEAGIIVDQLIDNALCGYKFAGLPRILAIARNPKTRATRQPVSIVQETPVSALLDGGNNVGYLAAYRGTEVAIEKSRHCGLAVVGVYNSYYSGRNAYYVEKMVRAGLVSIHVASGEARVFPPGAARPALGTNPIAFGFPSAQGPLVFDMGTASLMGGELLLYSLIGKALPEGVGFDEEGRPTRDAAAALRGGIVPFGGYKGYGLSLSIQAFGLLAGAALAQGRVLDYGFFFLGINPDLLVPGGKFPEHVAELVRQVKGLPRQPGVAEIRVPSERATRERERRRQEGIVIERTVVDALNAL